MHGAAGYDTRNMLLQGRFDYDKKVKKTMANLAKCSSDLATSTILIFSNNFLAEPVYFMWTYWI